MLYPKTTSEWKLHYQDLSSHYVVELSHLEQSKHHIVADWVNNVVSDSLILDIGCGIGYLSHLIEKEYIGIDLCHDALSIAKRLVCRRCGTLTDASYLRDFIVADMNHLPFHESSFDCVVFSDSIYYSRNVRRALRESFSVLKTHGVGVILHHSQRFVWSIEPVLKYLEELGNATSILLKRLGEPFKLILSFRKI